MVELSISDVRRALWREMPAAASGGEASNPLLGQIFHEATAELLGDDPALRWQEVIDQETLGNAEVLQEHIYEKLLGPRLAARQGALHNAGEQLIALWKATGELSRWLTGLITDAQRHSRIRFDKDKRLWIGDPLCLPEQSLTWDVIEPGWQAPVRVSGIADSLWKNPATGRWCVVEYKLGRGSREIDLAQVCLYHEMLTASGMSDQNGAVALVAFKPEREETFFASSDLTEVKVELRHLIGSLAGVTGSDHLAAAPTRESGDEAAAAGRKLIETFKQYGVEVILMGEPLVGPSFIRFGIMPGKGVKVGDIKKREAELQVHMNLETPPMIHTDHGRLVIDVKRAKPEPMLFAQLEKDLPQGDALQGSAEVLLGVDLTGYVHYVDLSQNTCPNLLVAGTAGSGKSEWLRSSLAGLLLANMPATLQLVLIDPKRSAFNGMEGSPYLYKGWDVLHPFDRPIAEVLDILIEEMNTRNLLFKEKGADDLAAFVAKTGKPLPRIVLFCDEYFDLIAEKKTRQDIEMKVARLGSKGRSSGIHLIIATQYPKADVVTGVLKANLSGRVCLRMTDAKQSQVVLGQSGAERLLGKGDLLFQDVGEPKRLQAAFLPEPDRKRIFSLRGPR